MAGCKTPSVQHQIMKKMTEAVIDLVQNPYGNYAIQTAIDVPIFIYILELANNHLSPNMPLFTQENSPIEHPKIFLQCN